MTPKQERFAQLYIELGNASEAYRQSYDAARMKAETVHRSAKEMLDNPKVSARLAELNAEHQARHKTTVDSLTDDLEEDRQLAHKAEQAGAAVSATLGKAKLHGLLKDKVEASGPDGGPMQVEDMTRTELARRILFTLSQAANQK